MGYLLHVTAIGLNTRSATGTSSLRAALTFYLAKTDRFNNWDPTAFGSASGLNAVVTPTFSRMTTSMIGLTNLMERRSSTSRNLVISVNISRGRVNRRDGFGVAGSIFFRFSCHWNNGTWGGTVWCGLVLTSGC